MEILSFGIDCAPGGKNSPGYAVRFPINLQPPTSLSTIVNTFPDREQRAMRHLKLFTIPWKLCSPSRGIRNDDLFVAKRVWDQRAESGYMRKMENAFQALASEIVAGNIVAVAAEHKPIIDEFYGLWSIRAKVRHLEPQEFTQSGLAGDDLTLDQQEILEKKGYAFMRPTGVPSRMVYGLRMQFEIRQTVNNLSAIQWGLVRPLSGRFLVPDNPKITMIPVSPTHCLCAGGQNGIITEQNLREVNAAAREASDRYYFALDLNQCP